MAGQVQVPRSLDQLPPALGLIAQRRSVCLIEKPAQLVGETDSSVGRAFITEEPFVDLGAVEHVKCVDDVLEAQPARGVDQLLLGDLASVVSPAGVQELAALRGALSVGHQTGAGRDAERTGPPTRRG
jgi:hypothetical protein